MTPRKDTKILYIRDVPETLLRKLKGAAGLNGMSMQKYILGALQAHVAELERKGRLPKARK
jgi:hypothetical protein